MRMYSLSLSLSLSKLYKKRFPLGIVQNTRNSEYSKYSWLSSAIAGGPRPFYARTHTHMKGVCVCVCDDVSLARQQKG